MTDNALASVDTITIASLMRALQVVIGAYHQHNPDPGALQALEREALGEIKALDTGGFAYEEQAEGLAEGLQLTRAVFRYAIQQAEDEASPGGGERSAIESAPACAQRT